ncbi:recombinase family protein [Amycolatopsis sp., V23-08]|uniref:Recombinase family protein n=1 Tax=Amycolatopsis heterodermiae TaxID=3110235 RepID=A0ABU5RJI1_9PSEU|nr:recombinase family protein [Amycolatopsis sp., V23-08]MEA5366443.1 recombinase family protein [Amycolatopsis sp., V23-08]
MTEPRMSDTNSARRNALEAAALRPTTKSRSATVNQQSSERDGLPIALIYLRVSTKEQARTGGGAEGYSIPAQRTGCHAKAAQLGALVHAEYVDAGESARSADRDDLQRLLVDVRKLRPDYVIVHKIDRLARNREDDIAINLALKKHGVKLVSCTENIDDTPQRPAVVRPHGRDRPVLLRQPRP